MDEQEHYRRLVQRYIENKATKEELTLFFHLLEAGKLDPYLEELDLPGLKKEASQNKQKRLFRSIRLSPYTVAASLLVVASTVAILLYNSRTTDAPVEIVTAKTAVPEAAPGSRKATLTLSNGETVSLDGQRQQLNDGATKIILNNDELLYEPGKLAKSIAYNIISTPRGGEYSVTLPDGSTVWLNAGSRLRYPTAFIGPERRVELTGEAYFQVAKNKDQPFIVEANGAQVKVLGTQFNIMAYADEAYLKTTLEEGAVVLEKNGVEKRLKPGEGGTINKGSSTIEVAAANIDLDLAWLRGYFRFEKTPLPVIMNQIGRWYDLDIRYAGGISDKRFVGRISRQANLSEVLSILQLSGVKFTLSGKTLTVED